MKKLVVLICLPFIIISCSSMGTNLRAINSEALNSIKRVGIAPYAFSNLPDDISQAEFHHIIEICDSTIIKNMKKQSQIEEILKINTDTLYINYYQNKNENRLNEYARIRNLDAILFFIITYRKTSVMFIPAVFSKTNLLVKKGDNLNLIFEAEYDNRFASDASTYEHSTEEGIEGSINIFISKLGKNKR